MKRALLAFFLLTASAAAQTAPPPTFWGFNLIQKVLRPVYVAWATQQGGSWNYVASCRPTNPTNPSDPCYNWSGLDTGLIFGQTNGIKLQYNMGYAPPWSNGNQGTQYPPSSLIDYTNWNTAYFTKYPNGKIGAATVWNEVNDPASPTGYAGTIPFLVQMEQSLCTTAHSLSPGTLVLAPSTYGASGLTYHVNYMAAGGNACTDAFSWHAYSLSAALVNNLEQWANPIAFYKALLTQYGRPTEPIYITEGGYSNSTADPYAEGALFPLFMANFATMSEPYAWDRPPGGNTSLDYWLSSVYPGDANARGAGYRTMQGWLSGATVSPPVRTALTNLIRNPNGTGFTAGTLGSGGVLPTNWSYNSTDTAFGVTAAVVGSCSNGAVTGVSIRVFTPTTVQAGASGSMTFAFESNGQVTTAFGQQMNVGVTVSLANGSMTNLGAQLAANSYNASNGFLSSPLNSTNALVVPIATPVTWNWKAAITDTTAAYIIPKFGVSYSVGNAFDATFCLTTATADAGSIWTASLTRPGGYSALIAWDSAGGPTTYSIPSQYIFQRSASNAGTPIVNNTSVLTQAPRLFETLPWAGAGAGDRPQYPNLLAGFTYKPTYLSPGVDYYVGLPSSVQLKDPATMTIPGTSVDLDNHRIIVDNSATNVTIDGYDFSLNGGWYVINYTNVGTLTIKNSNFVVGSNHQTPINALYGSGNITLISNTFDGNFDLSTTLSTFISYSGTGTLTCQYNWFKRAVSDVIDVNSVPANIVLQYNLFDSTGAPGVHGDIIQILGTGPYYATVLHNTVRQPAGLSAQGFMLEPDNGSTPGVVSGGEVAYNTLTGAISYFTAVTLADLTGTYMAHDNYFELADGAFNFAPGAGSGRGGFNDGYAVSIYTNNTNMVDGTKYQDTPPGTP